MKILFWILAILSIAVGLFVSVVCYASHGLGLTGTGIGEVVCIVGMLAAVICMICTVLGSKKLRKGDAKRAVVFAVAGLVYCGIIIGGIFLDDAVDTLLLKKSIAERNAQLYGENWDAPPAIEGIPERYQEVLNKYYAVIRDQWPAERLMDLGAVSMAEYYGDAPLDNIGFVLMDLNGDKVDELVIGAVAQAEQQGNEIFCIYSDPQNPSYVINGVEGKLYYLHSGEADGTYEAEIVGHHSAWIIETAERENTFDFNLKEGAMDPDGRMTLDLIPFSRYK
jgi:hypothetical protein